MSINPSVLYDLVQATVCAFLLLGYILLAHKIRMGLMGSLTAILTGIMISFQIFTLAQLDFDVDMQPPFPTKATAPSFSQIPKGLTFTCKDRIPGYYADVEASCQVWHWCLPSGYKYSFLCPNGTVFNQNFRVCDWWFNVDCASAVSRYNVNEDLYRRPDGTII